MEDQTGIPPGVTPKTLYYIKVVEKGRTRENWVARYTNSDRTWNIGPYFADGFDHLPYAKKLVRQLSKRVNWEDATFTIHSVTTSHSIYQIHPIQVLDALAHI